VIRLGTGRLSLKDLRAISRDAAPLGLDPDCVPRLEQSHAAVKRIRALRAVTLTASPSADAIAVHGRT